ncbi:MAG: LPS biosynthesis protein [Flavobacteriales bacterium]|nr:LPS biosynthesis protein [Flavobacteriales bacterium]
MKINYCKKCLNPSNHPLGIIFNEDGICSGCYVHEEKYEINWEKKIRKLKKFFSKYKNKYSYDCIIPINGNGDDYFVTHTAKHILGLRPLLVSYNNHFNTKVGIRNTANLVNKLDCEHINITINPKLVREITKTSLNSIGDMYWHILAGNQAFPVQIACKMNIPFILWGVNGWLDQVGKFSHYHEVEMTKKIWEEFSLRNFTYIDLLKRNKKIKHRDLAPLIYPSLNEIKDKNIRGIYLGNYVLWDAKKQTEDMIKLYGYETMEQQRTHNTYESIYCKNNAGVHDYIKYLKHGYGKVTDHLNRDIRFKRISREEAIKIRSYYEPKQPEDLNIFLNWINTSKKDFFSIINKHSKINTKSNSNSNSNSNKKYKVSKTNIASLEKKLNYKKTKLLEKETLKDDYIVFGRSYSDKRNFKALKG